MRTSTLLFGVWLGLLTVAALRPLANSAEPGRKPTLWLALDDNAASRMLRAELSRDWTRPNRAVILTPAQRRDLAEIGRRMNGVKEVIVRQFVIVYVGPESPPAARRFSLPALRINRGRWESIDRRAFAFETRPLLTLDWYRAVRGPVRTRYGPGGDLGIRLQRRRLFGPGGNRNAAPVGVAGSRAGGLPGTAAITDLIFFRARFERSL